MQRIWSLLILAGLRGLTYYIQCFLLQNEPIVHQSATASPPKVGPTSLAH
jgi:hypothetical protein